MDRIRHGAKVLTDTLLLEFDREMGTTRRLLERVPGDRLGWKPHEKSMTLGRLASHLAEVAAWGSTIAGERSVNVEPDKYRPFESGAAEEILAIFDKNVAAARLAIASKCDAELMAPWTLMRNGHELFTIPKVAVIRSFLMSHLIHHRGQLCVYLLMNDVPLPAIYGPGADEG